MRVTVGVGRKKGIFGVGVRIRVRIRLRVRGLGSVVRVRVGDALKRGQIDRSVE